MLLIKNRLTRIFRLENLVNEIQNNLQHLILVRDPVHSWSLSVAGQININARPALPLMEDWINITYHVGMVYSSTL
jgi:hypothetical protein